MEWALSWGVNLSRRSNKRISLEFPLEVRGKDESGHVFVTKARTRNASAHGGCVVIDKDLNKGETISVISPKGDHFPAKVCWVTYDYRTDERFLGFTLLGAKDRWVLSHGKARDFRRHILTPKKWRADHRKLTAFHGRKPQITL
jgi:hypothetical protein